MSTSQQLVDTTVHKLYTQLFIFWFQLFRSAGKIDEDDALVHLELFPHQQSLAILKS
jgi:hypothetical protein